MGLGRDPSWPEAAAGGGGGGGTIVVYASDALEPSGDYICDGTADQVTVLAAVNALPMSGGFRRGTVVLSEGIFNFNDSLVLPAASNPVVIIGQGGAQNWWNDPATVVKMTGATTNPIIDGVTNDSGITLKNLSVEWAGSSDGDCIHVSSNNGATIIGCSIVTSGGNGDRGIELLTNAGTYGKLSVIDCLFGTDGANIYIDLPYLAHIENCYFYSRNGGVATTDYCVEIVGDGTPGGLYNETFFQILNCRSDGNGFGVIHCSNGATTGIIANNTFWYDSVATIKIEDSNGIQIINNQIGDMDSVGGAIRLDTADACIVSNNTLFSCYFDGIVLVDSDSNQITNNMLINIGIDTDDTHSGILLDGDSNENMVVGNMARLNADSGDTEKLKYAIRIDDATCDDNIVYGNDVKGSYVTAGFSDAGTGTVTTAGNRS